MQEEAVKNVFPVGTKPTPAIGRIVHYVLTGGYSEGQHRPAIIVRYWESESPLQRVQLQVFTDASNDYMIGIPGSTGMFWATSIPYSETAEPGTWHWPEFVPNSK